MEAKIQKGINDFADAHMQTVAMVNGLQQQNAQLAQMLQQRQQQMAAMQIQMATMATAPPQHNNNWNGYGGRGGRGTNWGYRQATNWIAQGGGGGGRGGGCGGGRGWNNNSGGQGWSNSNNGRPPTKTHSSNTRTTTTAGVAAGAWSPGTQAEHTLQPRDTQDTKRQQTRTTQWAVPTEKITRKSCTATQDTHAMGNE